MILTVLGPLLFLIYINDIAYALPGMKPKLFADDINLFISGIDKTELNIKCSNFLAALHRWFVANYLYMNFDKTNVMVFPSAKQANISVKLNGTPITKVTNCRYLGLYIDSNLN